VIWWTANLLDITQEEHGPKYNLALDWLGFSRKLGYREEWFSSQKGVQI
jgi:hypothetical protein